jgi:hypothetical protein
MMKKVVLLAAALTLALPAFADTPKAIDKAAKAPVSKSSTRKWSRTGNATHAFSYQVKPPLDSHSTGKAVGKRKHDLPVKP